VNTGATPLAANPCRSLCSWHATPAQFEGEQLFACRGCGSQWTVAEAWTPIDYNGNIPAQVKSARLATPPPRRR